jgi:ribosomal-protein-alanine N-acetyltransferase
MGEADASAMARLHARCFAPGWDEQAMRALLTAPGALGRIAETEGDMIAFALLRRIIDEGEVVSMAVAPDWRRRGLGCRLLADALAAAATHGVRRVTLEVAADNAPAQALYRRLGFAAVGRRRAYYGGVDADVLALDLAGVKAAAPPCAPAADAAETDPRPPGPRPRW